MFSSSAHLSAKTVVIVHVDGLDITQQDVEDAQALCPLTNHHFAPPVSSLDWFRPFAAISEALQPIRL